MITVISDTHLHNWSLFNTAPNVGENSRLNIILDSIEEAAKHARQRRPKGDTTPVRLYHGGDLFHVRGSLTPSVLNKVISRLNEIYSKYRVEIIIIAGNHDLETKDSCELGNAAHSLNSLPFVEVVSSPELFSYDKVAMLPWRDSLNDLRADIKNIAEAISKTDNLKQWTLIIHAPVNGVVMGIPDHGFDGEELVSYGFGLVLSGHYHNHKEVAKQVYSIGALTHQTWGDVASLAGFLTVDDDLVVTHLETSAPKFTDYDAKDEARAKGNYVRVRLGEATESELKTVRQHVLDLGALGVVIQSMPARAETTRSGSTVEAGKSMLGSIEAWLSDKEITCDKADVLRECELILGAIEA